MSELYFRAGEAKGFNAKELADKKDGYANPIRELLQNSLDASKEANNKKCEINIYIDSIRKSDIPHIDQYKAILKQAIKFHKKENSYGRNAQQIVGFIEKALEKDSLDILMFVDNGIGMSPKILNDLIGERSVKSDESSGGSFGVGHLSSYFLSSLRYVLYASKYKDNNITKTLFSGSPILAGYEDLDGISRGNIGRILEQKPDNELIPNYIFPTEFPSFMQSKMDEIDETGSMVIILGLNKGWDKEANYAIVSNFFYAINKQELTVNVDYGSVENSINEQDIDRLLAKNKEQKNAAGDSILSGQAVYQSWLTVKDDDCKKEIQLNNGEKVFIYIRNNIDSASVIVLIRNGMLIARHDNMLSNSIDNLRKNEDFEPFSIIINVDERDCPKLFELVKGAENPYHNKLERNRLIPEDEGLLKKLLDDLSKKIRDSCLEERDRTGSLVSMPLLEIPSKAETQGVNTNRPRSQKPKAQVNKQKPKQPTRKINKTNGGKKRQAPIIVSRVLESTNAVRFKDNGNTFTVNLNITPQKMEAKDEVYLSMSLAQDNDKNKVDTGLDFVSLSIDGNDISIPDFIEFEKDGIMKKEKADKSQIKLGKLLKEQTYNIIATIKKPEKIKGMGVALKPFLGLKQSKGVNYD